MIALAFAAGVGLGLWLGLNVAENLFNALQRNLHMGQHQAAELADLEEIGP